jgi:hypothetical protein
MATISFPHRPVRTDQLREEIGRALDIPEPYVDISEDGIDVIGMVSPEDKSAIADVIAAHVPDEYFALSADERRLAQLRRKETPLSTAETAEAVKLMLRRGQ